MNSAKEAYWTRISKSTLGNIRASRRYWTQRIGAMQRIGATAFWRKACGEPALPGSSMAVQIDALIRKKVRT
ncbi:MAG: hypothetical protein KGO96_07850 [Elusimicrobia bacterium]|nr:hypothetical protein [Elusimicrobiota bacterium]MDE2425805.1 hypothetical protein [Elusimicrobiota bacterium]